MFGLEGQKKKKRGDEFVFDLEAELKSDRKRSEIKRKIEDKVQKIKGILTTGDNKEGFDAFGILLHGYASLQKVISRVPLR